MRFIGAIINIVIGIIIVLFGSVGLSNHFGGNDKNIIKYESLLAEGNIAMGVIDSMYTETSIKGIKMYSSHYTFTVDDKEYRNSFSFDSPDELDLFLKVHYSAADPTINTAYIDKKLASAKKSKNSNADLLLGSIAVLFGLALMYFRGIRRFLKGKPAMEQAPATHADNDEYV